MIIFGTGHRPEDANILHLSDLVDITVTHLLTRSEASTVITGMAAGFDLALGLAAMELELDVIAARPWAGHTPRKSDAEVYDKIWNYATRNVTVDPSYTYPGPWVYHNRNQWMVDNADEGVAFWSGKTSGGTYACLQYAEKKKKPVINIYPTGE